MQIRNLVAKNPAFLAPMAGYTDMVFRQICKQRGAGLVYTEFVSADAIVRHKARTMTYLRFEESERPVGVQVFGSDPQTVALAVELIAEQFQPDLIDLNFGCSVRKVVKKQAGAALLKDLPLLQKIAEAAVGAVALPVTAKYRMGWSPGQNVAVEVAQRLEQAGVAAITIHPRTAIEAFKMPADWKVIAAVKAAVSIPVIGNGDIKTAEDAKRMLIETGCDAVMIGRGALANPWIFQQVAELLQTGIVSTCFSPSDKVLLCLEHLQREAELVGFDHATRLMKKFYGWYFRGIPAAARIREQLVRSNDYHQTYQFLISLLK